MHNSSTQQLHMTSSCHREQHRCRRCTSSEKVLSDSAPSEDYVRWRKEVPKDSVRNKQVFCQITMHSLENRSILVEHFIHRLK